MLAAFLVHASGLWKLRFCSYVRFSTCSSICAYLRVLFWVVCDNDIQPFHLAHPLLISFMMSSCLFVLSWQQDLHLVILDDGARPLPPMEALLRRVHIPWADPDAFPTPDFLTTVRRGWS
jgi:hypothetical protein